MKIRNVILFLSFITCITALILSCKQNSIDNTLPNKRLEFLKTKNIGELKSNYRSLPDNEKKELWIDKIHQIQTQSLTSEQLTIISNLEKELMQPNSSFSMENDVLKNLGIRLASITPREDFLNMFSSLENFTYKGFDSNKQVCLECVNDMQNEVRNIKSLNTRALPCTCRWNCPDGPGKVTSNCDQTSIGCGWFWLQSCKKGMCIDC
jgi:hypothetical protein